VFSGTLVAIYLLVGVWSLPRFTHWLRRDIHRYKEKQYVGNYFDRRFGVAVIGGAAHVASQPTVGLLPEWRAWLDYYGSDHPVTAGSDLGGSSILTGSRMKMAFPHPKEGGEATHAVD
jgi:hypothetical protein